MTLLLIGLWHGFEWNQIIWASMMATLIVIESYISFPKLFHRKLKLTLAWFFTFFSMLIARIFSTTPLTADALNMVWNLVTNWHFKFYLLNQILLIMTLLAVVLPHFVDFLRIKYPIVYQNKYLWFIFISLFVSLTLIFISPHKMFIYEAL
jgi:D-alanyl-lipoteichoic acid acyltransferase DltB (MBOAT superfamily)